MLLIHTDKILVILKKYATLYKNLYRPLWCKENDVKKLLGGFLLLICPFFCSGANFDELTDEDAGQLLFNTRSGTVLVFKKRVDRGDKPGYWACTAFRGNRVFNIYPGECSLLNYTEQTLTPEAVAIEYAYWSCKRRFIANAYRQLAEKINAPASNKIIFFNTELASYLKTFRSEIDEYKSSVRKAAREQSKSNQTRTVSVFQSCPVGNSNSSASSFTSTVSVGVDLLKSSLQNAVVVKSFQDIADADKNFFVAFCMYLRYKYEVSQLFYSLSRSVRGELEPELLQSGEDIRVKFVQERNYNQAREKAFKNLCGKHGRWEFAPPADLKVMETFLDSCYLAWQKIQTLSPESEFPEWGNAALEVMQMMRMTALEQKYDNAYNGYEKYNSN